MKINEISCIIFIFKCHERSFKFTLNPPRLQIQISWRTFRPREVFRWIRSANFMQLNVFRGPHLNSGCNNCKHSQNQKLIAFQTISCRKHELLHPRSPLQQISVKCGYFLVKKLFTIPYFTIQHCRLLSILQLFWHNLLCK